MFTLKILGVKRKLFWGFKYIRFKSSFKLSSVKESEKDVIGLRTCQLAEMLDCTNNNAGEIIFQNTKILTIESESLIRNVTFCKKHLKFSYAEFARLISLNSSTLQHRYFSLLELGCSNITASSILKYQQVIKKSPSVLQREDVYFSYEKHLEYCTPFLSDSDRERKCEINSSIQNMYRDGSSLLNIKEAMNAEILASKLDCSLCKVHQMFQRYPPLRMQSIEVTLKLLDVLFQKYKFPVSRTFCSPILLSLHPEIVENFLEGIPDILGVSTVELVHKLPLLLRRPIDSVRQVESILKDFNITHQQLLCCPKVLLFTPQALQERLRALCSSPDFALFKNYKKFLLLVYHFSRLQTRLDVLKEVDIPCSITKFTVSHLSFYKHLRFSNGRTHIKDTCYYLSEVLDCNEKDVLAKLREFPNLSHSSVTNCYKVVKLLLSYGINKTQLFNGLGIVFYDINIVKLYFSKLQKHPACQPFSEWISHYNLIQLLIYAIEVDSGFKGSRLHKARFGSADSDEIGVSSFKS